MNLEPIVAQTFSLAHELASFPLTQEHLDLLDSIHTHTNTYVDEHAQKLDEGPRTAQLLIGQAREELKHARKSERPVQQETTDKLVKAAELLKKQLS